MNMFGGLGDLAGLIKQARGLQERMAEAQKELQAKRYQGEAGGGAVVATVDGKGTLVDIRIQPEAAHDVELLEDLVKAAIGVATKKSHEAMQNEMGRLTGALNIPGLSELLGGESG